MRGQCEEGVKPREGSDPRKSRELLKHGSDEDTEGWDGGATASTTVLESGRFTSSGA